MISYFSDKILSLKKLIPILLLAHIAFGQTRYPKNYFRNPLDVPIVLAGTFGELRSNHFHAGMDLKTKQREGLNVYAAADGYVSRIKVALWGYGKVIYITHPNGYTSVYAHLKKFGKGIESYVKNIQYQKESYETGNIFPKEGEIPIKKGQIIGFSGSTGGFVAPHLHFEIRDTKTEHIINPMHFGLVPKDTIVPSILKLMAYPIGSNSRINRSNKRTLLPLRRIKPGLYRTNKISAHGRIGFAINTSDQLNATYNRNGVYAIEMLVNGNRVYYHDVETFSFAESKYINLHIDYDYWKRYKSRVQKTFKEPKNKLSTYKKLVNDGVISINDTLDYTVTIKSRDFAGNVSKVIIPVSGAKNNPIFGKPIDSTRYKITHQNFNKFAQKGITVAFPKGTFYEDFYMDFVVNNDSTVQVHKPTLPLHRNYTLTFNVENYSEQEKAQMYIANIDNKRYPSYVNTIKKEKKFFTSTKSLGKFTLLKDSIEPRIYKPNFRKNGWLSNADYLKIRIEDKQSGIKEYKAFIDNEWILMEYNLKRKELFYDFSDKKLVGNKHIFKLVVLDNVGNTNVYSATFYRKP